MEEIEKLLAEYKIRFRDTDGFIGMSGNDFPSNIQIVKNYIWNRYGRVYYNGVWQIAAIKQAPEKWVVGKDESNPLWNIFKDYIITKHHIIVGGSDYYSQSTGNVDLLFFKDHQYLTLEQWHELIYLPEQNEPNDRNIGIVVFPLDYIYVLCVWRFFFKFKTLNKLL